MPREPLNLAYHLYRHASMMCHFLISYPLNVYVSFPDMMQGDKGNIKVNLGNHIGIIRFYCGIMYFVFIATRHYTTKELMQ